VTKLLTTRTISVGFLFAALAVLGSFTQAALAETSVSEDPQRLVVDTINQLIDRLKENSEQIQKDDSIAYRISDELVAPHIDFPRVTRLVIGKYWQTASEQQRQALIAEIQSLMIRSYVTAMTSYADQIVARKDRINFLPSRYKSGDSRASVRANITLDNGQVVEVQYHLYNGDGKWRIYDIGIEGVSLTITYRTSFGEQIKKDGIDSLIARLSERNRKGEVELAPSAVTKPLADKNAL
jgi:phospholipid transport system substrate-binding protein